MFRDQAEDDDSYTPTTDELIDEQVGIQPIPDEPEG